MLLQRNKVKAIVILLIFLVTFFGGHYLLSTNKMNKSDVALYNDWRVGLSVTQSFLENALDKNLAGPSTAYTIPALVAYHRAQGQIDGIMHSTIKSGLRKADIILRRKMERLITPNSEEANIQKAIDFLKMIRAELRGENY